MTAMGLKHQSQSQGDAASCSVASIRLLLVGAHRLFWAGIRRLLEDGPGVTIVGEATDHDEVLSVSVDTHPDLILLDLDAEGASGLDILRDLQAAAPQAHVLVLAGPHDAERHHRAVLLGARGLVCKDQASEVLVRAIAAVHAGEVWLDPALVARVLAMLRWGEACPPQDPEAVKIAMLSAREREVIALIGQGLKNQVIAERLYLSEATVRHHLTAILAKLDLADRLELVVYAYCHGLASSPR
jgi:two-component system nitrate/nitrite response regulator NarL